MNISNLELSLKKYLLEDSRARVVTLRASNRDNPPRDQIMDLTNMLNGKGPNGVAAKAEKYQHQLAQVNTSLRAANSYPSPSELQQPMSRMGYGERPYDNLYSQPQNYDHRLPGQGSPTDEEISPASANAKSFPCATCAKGKAISFKRQRYYTKNI